MNISYDEAKEPGWCSDNSGKETNNLKLELRTISILMFVWF